MTMKIKFGLIGAVALGAVALTGCLDSTNNGEFEKIEPVRPGLYIYSAASSQNEIAMQPADFALRLSILRAEAVKQGKLADLNTIIVPDAGNVKTLLFGSTTKITADEAGNYEITYAGGGGMPMYDTYARVGSVRVRTGGVALEATDASTRWSVEMVSERMHITGSRNVILTNTGNTSIYRKDAGYEIGFSNVVAYIDNRMMSDWTGAFVWTPAEVGDLSFSAQIDKTFGLNGSADGTSFWSLNNLIPADMSYEVADGKYEPAVAGNRQIVSGMETCLLTDPEDYNATAYPAPDVKLVWSYAAKRLMYTVHYNGHSVELTY